ncbi:MAG: ATP-binding protein [Ileibacterium sp.]|nr:ATP-binding protein [Ileibacterium sp.]
MEIKKIVLTGGPCGGKSTGMEWIRKEYEKRGWRVLAVDECATEIIKAGVVPGRSNTNFDFELPIVQLQKAKEEIFEQAASQLPDSKILIIYDRGFLDMKTYCTNAEFEEICKAVGMSEDEMKHRYDGIFHLTTTAKGAEQYYTFANNEARYQSVEEAKKADDDILEVWKGHPHIRVIDNSTSFQSKMERLMREIDVLLNEDFDNAATLSFKVKSTALSHLPKGILTETKRYVLTELLDKQDMHRSLMQNKKEDGSADYFLQYAPVNGQDQEPTQKKISRNEYADLMLESSPKKTPSSGRITSFFWEHQYVELIQDVMNDSCMDLKITARIDQSTPSVPEFLLQDLIKNVE